MQHDAHSLTDEPYNNKLLLSTSAVAAQSPNETQEQKHAQENTDHCKHNHGQRHTKRLLTYHVEVERVVSADGSKWNDDGVALGRKAHKVGVRLPLQLVPFTPTLHHLPTAPCKHNNGITIP